MRLNRAVAAASALATFPTAVLAASSPDPCALAMYEHWRRASEFCQTWTAGPKPSTVATAIPRYLQDGCRGDVAYVSKACSYFLPGGTGGLPNSPTAATSTSIKTVTVTNPGAPGVTRTTTTTVPAVSVTKTAACTPSTVTSTATATAVLRKQEGFHAGFGYDPFRVAKGGTGAFFNQVDRGNTAGEGNWVFEASFAPGGAPGANYVTLETLSEVPVTANTVYTASFLARISNAANRCTIYMRVNEGGGINILNDNLYIIANDFQFQRFEFDFNSGPWTAIRQQFVITCSDANNFPIVQLDAVDIRRKGT